jgi:hypothetical protein
MATVGELARFHMITLDSPAAQSTLSAGASPAAVRRQNFAARRGWPDPSSLFFPVVLLLREPPSELHWRARSLRHLHRYFQLATVALGSPLVNSLLVRTAAGALQRIPIAREGSGSSSNEYQLQGEGSGSPCCQCRLDEDVPGTPHRELQFVAAALWVSPDEFRRRGLTPGNEDSACCRGWLTFGIDQLKCAPATESTRKQLAGRVVEAHR